MAYCFFLGANSKDGFVSFYPHLSAEGRRLYLIKGGPGCGKSTCIRKLAEALGPAEEHIFCSSDPDSLDGAVLGELAILDGTAPHVAEPGFPGCTGDYLALPPLTDLPALREQAPALFALKAASGCHYDRAYRLLRAAAALREDRRERLLSTLRRAPVTRATALAREIPRTEGPGRLYRRFLDGITPKGQLCLWETVAAFPRVIALEDSCGLCHPLLEVLLEQALAKGQTVYGCYDPLEPDRLLHLLLPRCGLAFVTKRQALPFLPQRAIHPEAAASKEALGAHRAGLRRMAHTEQALLEEAVGCIAAAHSLHDKMEAIYRPHLDKEALDACRQDFLARIR